MSVRRSVFWAFGGQAASVLTGLATSIVVARLLSPHEMGIYAVAFAVLGVLQIVAAFDMATYVVREKELAPRTLDAAAGVNALLQLALAAAVLGLSFAGAAVLGEPGVARALQWLAIGPLLSILEFRPLAMLQRDMRFRAISIVTTGKTMASAAVTILTAMMGASYLSLAWGNIAYALFGVVAYGLVGRAHAVPRLSFENWRPMAAFGLRMMSISGLANLVGRLSEIVLGRVLGLAALGLYSRASGISALLFQNVYGTATRVVFVQLARDWRERGVLRDTFLRGIQMITAVMWPMLIGLALLARPVVLLLFGERWLGAALPMALLLSAQVVVLGFGMNWELFVLRDETARQTRFEAARAAIGLALFVAGCAVSLTAAAASRIVEALVGLLLYLPHMNRLAGTTTAELVSAYRQSAVLALLATAPVLAVMLANRWSAATPWSLIVPAVLLGVLLWTIGLAAMRHPLFDEIRLLWARRTRQPA